MKLQKYLKTLLLSCALLACFGVKGASADTVVDGFTIQCTDGVQDSGRIDLTVSTATAGVPILGYTYDKLESNELPPDIAHVWTHVSWVKTGTITIIIKKYDVGTHTFTYIGPSTLTPKNCVVVEATFPLALQYYIELFGVGTWVTISEQIVPAAFIPTGTGALDEGKTYAIIPKIEIPLSETLRIYASPTCSNITFTKATQLPACDYEPAGCTIPTIEESYSCITLKGAYNFTIPAINTYSGTIEKCFTIHTMTFPGCAALGIPEFNTGDLICNALNSLIGLVNNVYPAAFTVTISCEAATCDCIPDAVKLSFLGVKRALGGNNVIWTTESEFNNAGYNVYRADAADGVYVKINSSLIPAEGSVTEGATYSVFDKAPNRTSYSYKLEDIDFNGTSTMHGPVSAAPRQLFGFGK